jgi:hypothetical protein
VSNLALPQNVPGQAPSVFEVALLDEDNEALLEPGARPDGEALVSWGADGVLHVAPSVTVVTGGTFGGTTIFEIDLTEVEAGATVQLYFDLASFAGNEAATVTIDNVALISGTNTTPQVDVGADVALQEGSILTRRGSFADPDDAETWSGTVNYGDGSGVQALALNADLTFDLAHTFADNGAFTVLVEITDSLGAKGSGSFVVTVANVAPTVSAGPDRLATVGESVQVSATFTDAGVLDTHLATIAWGDGTITSGVVDPATRTVTGTHIYQSTGNLTATITVTDDDGASGSDILQIGVSAEIALTLQAPAQVNEGQTFTLTLEASASQQWTGSVDFSDGTAARAISFSGTTGQVQHVYGDNGQFTITAPHQRGRRPGCRSGPGDRCSKYGTGGKCRLRQECDTR